MEAALRDLDALIDAARAFDAVDEPTVPGDPAGPPACQGALQGFWLAQTGEHAPPRILD